MNRSVVVVMMILSSFGLLGANCAREQGGEQGAPEAPAPRPQAESPQATAVVPAIRFISGLTNPEGINVDAAGNIYVAEFGRHRVLRYSPDLELTGWLGESDQPDGWRSGPPERRSGPGLGQLSKPHAVAFDAAGNLYVTEYGNNRIQKFSPGGVPLGMLGVGTDGTLSDGYSTEPTIRTGSKDGLMVGLASAFFFGPESDLFVTDYGSSSIIRFSLDGKYKSHVGGLNKPHMVAVDADGIIYVADTWNHRLVRFGPSWQPMGWLGAGEDGQIQPTWRQDGKAVASAAPGGLNAPVSILLDPDGNLLVAEFENPRIQKYARDGRYLGWIGGRADGSINLSWETTGEALAGSAPGQFFQPYDVRVRGQTLYVCEKGNGRVQIIDLSRAASPLNAK